MPGDDAVPDAGDDARVLYEYNHACYDDGENEL
jgi:hypothetical protein